MSLTTMTSGHIELVRWMKKINAGELLKGTYI